MKSPLWSGAERVGDEWGCTARNGLVGAVTHSVLPESGDFVTALQDGLCDRL